jgi:hypothetical protein
VANPHDAQTEIHPPFFRGPTPPTSTSLGYPLQVGHEWVDTSGGIGVLRRCTAVDGGVGTWALDGPAVVKLPLGDGDAAGGILAWQNPEGVAIVVTALRSRITTAPPERLEFAWGTYNTSRIDAVDQLADPLTGDTQHGGFGPPTVGLHDANTVAVVADGGWLLASAIPFAALVDLAAEPSGLDTETEWLAAFGTPATPGNTYRNTLDGQLYIITAYDEGTGAITWNPIDDPSVAGESGYAYVYYHLA